MAKDGVYYNRTTFMSNPVEVSIADIESALTQLWESQSAKNNIKANLYNLVIYAPEQSQTTYLQEIMRSLIEQFPGRIIFIQGNPDPSQDYLKSYVSNTLFKKDNVAIACDQIVLEVSKSQLHRIPFVVLPHLLPDLPLYLLWGQDPSRETEILPYLRPYALRLIFDSGCTESLQRFSRKILEDLKKWKIEIMDLNWASIAPWREIMASLFDTQERINQIRSAQNIQISYNACHPELMHKAIIPALYFQGWIASQLGWTYHSSHFSSSEKIIHYETMQGPCDVILTSQVEKNKLPGSILSLTIESTEDQNFSIIQDAKYPRVIIRISRADLCEMPFSLSLPDIRRGSTLMKELFYRKTSPHYQRMLALISNIDSSTKGSS
jgi:glucose-6-phosphate dehydrogenase assembly protein OpcA